MGLSHPLNGRVGRDAPGKVKTVIRRQESPGASPLPFVGITESLPHGATDLSCFPRTDPDDRVGAGNIREFELIDAGLCIFCPFGGGVIKGRHIFGPTDLLKFAVFVPDGQLAESLLSRSPR